MLHEHAAAVERESQAFQKETGPIFPSVSKSGAIDRRDLIESHRDLVALVRRLYGLSVSHQDRLLKPSQSQPNSAQSTFARSNLESLALIEELASKIRQYPMKE